ncbi:anti-sigma factor family protein [Actinokineospora sp.]|uniref:anti-sigma factor family protein n=1 Tax=Actinokineospora sp. TaxID=1872133 RepID=UPI0040383DBE
MSCPRTTSLGAYLLGALDLAERAEFEAHLAACESCRTELVRLAPLPGLLHRITTADFEDADPTEDVPTPAALDSWARLEADQDFAEPATPVDEVAARRNRGRRRLRVLAAAAVVVVALGVGGVVGYGLLRPPAAPEPVTVSWSATNPTSGAHADVDLIDRAWGTEVRIRLSEVPPGKPCMLVVRDREGNREIAGWWSTGFTPDEEIPGSTSFDLNNIATVEVVTEKTVLVDVPAPA